MDLENEAGEIILIRVYHTLYRMDRTWRGSDTDKEQSTALSHRKLFRAEPKNTGAISHPNTYSHQIRDKPLYQPLYPHELRSLRRINKSRDPD